MLSACLLLMRLQINDRYEFEELLDLDRNDRAYLSEKADPNVRNLCALFTARTCLQCCKLPASSWIAEAARLSSSYLD